MPITDCSVTFSPTGCAQPVFLQGVIVHGMSFRNEKVYASIHPIVEKVTMIFLDLNIIKSFKPSGSDTVCTRSTLCSCAVCHTAY